MEKKADEVLDMKKFDFTSYKKLVVFGDSKVGKSCLLQRLENDIFLEEKENDLIEYKRITVGYPNIPKVTLNTYEFKFENLFDPLENEKYVFEALQLDCYAFIFMYDISVKESFQNLLPYFKSLDFKKYPYLKIIFVGNKMDLGEKGITKEDVKKKIFNIITEEDIQQNNLDFYEVSLMDKTNLDDLFKTIHQNIYNKELEVGFRAVQEAKAVSVSVPDNVTLPEIRISLLGEQSVGKTAFVNRFMNNAFENTVMTVGYNFKIKFLKLADIVVKFYVWDTAGQERFKDALPKTLFQNADGILLLVDVCQKDVDKTVDKWVKDISEKVGVATEKNGFKGKAIMYLIGNKIDIVREIFQDDKNIERVNSRGTIEDIAEKYGVQYFETSCKTNINISDVIYRIANECYERLPPEKKKLIVKGKEGEDDGCCGGGKKKKKKATKM